MTHPRNWVWLPLIAGVALGAVGCDDGGKKSQDQEQGDPIEGFGTTDLDFDCSPIEDPRIGLPPLEDTEPEYTPALADQELPAEPTEILELDKVAGYMGLSESELADMLRTDGVVRKQNASNRELMAEALSAVGGNWDQPGVLLTSDALFNTFHNFFDNLLLGVELRTLRPRVLAMLEATKAAAAQRYNSLPEGDTKAAALDVVAYLQVAHSLMDPDAERIAEVNAEVQAEIDLIMAHAAAAASPIFDRPDSSTGDCATFDDPCDADCGTMVGEEFIPCPERYCEDYTQYVPRGHYTYNVELEQYFRSVMWLGRMTFLNRSDQSTRGAVVLVDSLKSAEVEIDGETVAAIDLWRQFFRVIGTFVGSMDDLNIAEIDGAVVEALGDCFALDVLDDDTAVDQIQDAVGELRDPEILSGFLNALADMAAATKGLRLLGQIYLPDSYALGQVVFGNTGASSTVAANAYEDALAYCEITANTDPEILTASETRCVCKAAWADGNWNVCRGMPSGLDVGAVLGSAYAEELALERFDSYAKYPAQLSDLIAEFSGFDLERWGLSLSWTWLYAIRGLLADPDEGAPAFMRTEAWASKTLETGLTSWAELRHDTILYVKQSYTGDMDGDTDTDTDTDVDYDFDYLEPQPEAYARLGAAARRLAALAGEEDLFQGSAANLEQYVTELADVLERAVEISINELEGQELSGSDIWWIRGSGAKISGLENNLLNSLELFDGDQEPDPDRLKTTIVADVHTWPQKQVVLEVGSGYLEYVTVLHQLPGGQWGVAVGPAFSYHEFEQDMANRLTDEEWREILEGDPDHGCPDWLMD